MFRRTPKLSDRERLRNQIVKEVALSSALAGFLCNGFNRGHAAKLTIEIDGLACEVAILDLPNEPLMEYLANWACAQNLAKAVNLGEFDKQGRSEQGNGSGEFPDGAILGDRPKNGGL